MALTSLQKQVMKVIAANRSETSYMAGGAVLNMNSSRISDDLDIFHDTDEEIVSTARADVEALESAGFKVSVDIIIYGVFECTVSRNNEATILQWMSETRYRFFPLVRDSEWGARLNVADLAVNKILAASSRSKPRDYIDLILIESDLCSLGPLVMAAAGKPPNFSPQRIVEEIRRRSLSIPAEDFLSVRGIPDDWSIDMIRGGLSDALDRAEDYIQKADPHLVGLLTVNMDDRPVELLTPQDASVNSLVSQGVMLRKATDQAQPLPVIKDVPPVFCP